MKLLIIQNQIWSWKIEVKKDFPYETKTDLKGAAGGDTSNLAVHIHVKVD